MAMVRRLLAISVTCMLAGGCLFTEERNYPTIPKEVAWRTITANMALLAPGEPAHESEPRTDTRIPCNDGMISKGPPWYFKIEDTIAEPSSADWAALNIAYKTFMQRGYRPRPAARFENESHRWLLVNENGYQVGAMTTDAITRETMTRDDMTRTPSRVILGLRASSPCARYPGDDEV